MNFNFTHWQISNQIAKTKNPYDKYIDGGYYDTEWGHFEIWAEAQSIPAPGVPDQAISVDEVEVKTFGCRHVDDDEFPSCRCGYMTPQAKLCPHSMKELIIKSSSQVATEIWGESNNSIREALEAFVNACYTGCNKEELNKLRINAENALKN